MATQPINLPVPEFEKAISQENIQLMGVRTHAEYQSGHLTNALFANWNRHADKPVVKTVEVKQITEARYLAQISLDKTYHEQD
ncbi:MAG: hypothetical protein ABIN89_15930 [Chitinophagaceae bacterium]